MKIIAVITFLLLATGSSFDAFGQGTSTDRSRTQPVMVGQVAPEISLVDASGNRIELSSLNEPVVLVFYRAYWCPFCIRQLAEFRSLKQEGFRILAISPDPIDRLKETKTKIAKDGKGEISFSLLSDPGSKTVNEYGVYDPTYAGHDVDGIPRAAIFILDKHRKVVWANVSMDYKKRPTLDEIKAGIALAMK